MLEWRLRWRGEEVGDVTDCRPEFPTGDAWVVFGDKKVWATCWNGGWGGAGKKSVMSPILFTSSNSSGSWGVYPRTAGWPGGFDSLRRCVRMGLHAIQK